MSRFPDDVLYSEQHLWLRLSDGRDVRVGATEYLLEATGTIIHVGSPIVGSRVEAGDACGELVSPAASTPLVAPLSGVVTAVNHSLVEQPELLHSSTYDRAWLFEIEVDADVLANELPLLDAEGYESLVEN